MMRDAPRRTAFFLSLLSWFYVSRIMPVEVRFAAEVRPSASVESTRAIATAGDFRALRKCEKGNYEPLSRKSMRPTTE